MQHSFDLRQLLIVSGIALVIMAVPAIVAGWLVAGRLLRPLRAMTTAARNISAANLHERLNLSGPDDELKQLADTFDDLLGRLDQSFQSQRQFVANASHELRTPHATMRVWLDVALAKPGPVPPHMVDLGDRLRHELDHVDQLLAWPACPRPRSAALGHGRVDAPARRRCFRRHRGARRAHLRQGP